MAKGTVMDLVMIVVILFGLAIGVMLGHAVLTEFQDMTVVSNPEINQTFVASGLTAIETFNTSFIIIVIGLIASTLIGAYMINTNPALFIISLILLTIVGIVTVPFSNAFYEFSRNDALTNATNSMSTMVTVMDYLPEIIILMGVVLAIIIYAKYGRGEV